MAQPMGEPTEIRINEASYIQVMEAKRAQARQQLDQQEAVIRDLIQENAQLRLVTQTEESEDASADSG